MMGLLSRMTQRSRSKHFPLFLKNCFVKWSQPQCASHHSVTSHAKTLRHIRLSDFRPLWTYSRWASFYGSGSMRHSTFADVIQKTDIEQIHEKCRRDAVINGCSDSLEHLVKKEMEMKYGQFLANLNEQDTRKLKIVQLEHSFLYLNGDRIPSEEEMTSKNWLDVIDLDDMELRLKYYMRLWSILRRAKLRLEKRMEYDLLQQSATCTESNSNNSIFLDTEYHKMEMRWQDNRLASAMQFGTPIVIDMGYIDTLASFEHEKLSGQLWSMYQDNRYQPDPFHLVFTNCTDSNVAFRHLALHHFIETQDVLATFTEKDHLEIFPQQDLVYLSAQGQNCMGNFNHNAVYILGAYADWHVRKKSSVARSKQQGIKCIRLPIDQHVRWRAKASKDLTMNQMISILGAVKSHISWKDAFTKCVKRFVSEESR